MTWSGRAARSEERHTTLRGLNEKGVFHLCRDGSRVGRIAPTMALRPTGIVHQDHRSAPQWRLASTYRDLFPDAWARDPASATRGILTVDETTALARRLVRRVRRRGYLPLADDEALDSVDREAGARNLPFYVPFIPLTSGQSYPTLFDAVGRRPYPPALALIEAIATDGRWPPQGDAESPAERWAGGQDGETRALYDDVMRRAQMGWAPLPLAERVRIVSATDFISGAWLRERLAPRPSEALMRDAAETLARLPDGLAGIPQLVTYLVDPGDNRFLRDPDARDRYADDIAIPWSAYNVRDLAREWRAARRLRRATVRAWAALAHPDAMGRILPILAWVLEACLEGGP